MQDLLNAGSSVRGKVRAYNVLDVGNHDHWEKCTEVVSNLVVYEWGAIVGRMLSSPVPIPMGMYLEFANHVASGTKVPVPPEFHTDRTRNIKYYNEQLPAGSDYLRVPLTSAQLASSDPERYPNGNEITFFARSQGLQGVRYNLPFSDVDSSVIYGAALVAFVDEHDFNRDLIFSSFYFPTEPVNMQVPKTASSQIGLEWTLTLE